MTKLYARFEIPKDKWRDSNQRLNPVVAGLRSSWIIEHASNTWKQYVKAQFNIEPIEPDDELIKKNLNKSSIKTISIDDEQAKYELMQKRLNEIEDKLLAFDSEHKKRIDSLKRKDKTKTGLTDDEHDELDALMNERIDINDSRTRQKRNLTALRQSIRKISDKNTREHEKAVKRAIIKARLVLNENRRLFNEPVRFHVRIHNISKHYYDAPNAYPTVKPIQDAGTQIGILWADDNNDYIPFTTFQGDTLLSRDNYVVDIICETFDEPLSEGSDIFKDFEKHV